MADTGALLLSGIASTGSLPSIPMIIKRVTIIILLLILLLLLLILLSLLLVVSCK